jgi:hypothetical protein
VNDKHMYTHIHWEMHIIFKIMIPIILLYDYTRFAPVDV